MCLQVGCITLSPDNLPLLRLLHQPWSYSGRGCEREQSMRGRGDRGKAGGGSYSHQGPCGSRERRPSGAVVGRRTNDRERTRLRPPTFPHKTRSFRSVGCPGRGTSRQPHMRGGGASCEAITDVWEAPMGEGGDPLPPQSWSGKRVDIRPKFGKS